MADLYTPFGDPQFASPFIDVDEWRDSPVRHRYIHGGFENGMSRFCMYLPEETCYTDRFFQQMTPVQAPEYLGQDVQGEESWIGFSLMHGAAFVMTNLGGIVNGGGDPSLAIRCAANCARYYREIADKMYGERHHYGYVFGGSGGGFKTISAIEITKDVWDGAAPFVIGSPMAIPNMFTVRAHVMRLLREKFEAVKDCIEPGGSGDPYAVLNEEQKEALLEAERMGFPMKTWCEYDSIGAGALPVLFPAVRMMDPTYFTDFWEKEGYLGADPNGSAVRDRICYESKIKGILFADGSVAGGVDETAVFTQQAEVEKGSYGVDEAWKNIFNQAAGIPVLNLEAFPEKKDLYTEGLELKVLSGELEGQSFEIRYLEGNMVTAKPDASGRDLAQLLKKLQPGDCVKVDNSAYIAIQTYHRHQYPGPDYAGWQQFVKEDGTPKYPQRPMLVGPMISYGGAGSIQNGMPQCKLIVLESMMDESALPWQADWYRRLIMKNRGTDGNDIMRLWYMEHCMHTDCEEGNGGDHQHIVSYIGALHQAILAVSDWVQKGIEPAQTTGYELCGAQVKVPETAEERKGIQPVVTMSIDGSDSPVCKTVKMGEEVNFTVKIDLPCGAGDLEEVVWSFEGEEEFYACGSWTKTEQQNGNSTSTALAAHVFQTPGTYFPLVRVSSNNTIGDPYTKIRNLARVRVVVE